MAETGELSHHVEVSGHDEFSQVAAGFNTMLDALDESPSAANGDGSSPTPPTSCARPWRQ